MSDAHHTLFLWLRGAFPRRIAFQLLIKGIVASAEDMIAGRTQLPNFKINIATMEVTENGPRMVDADQSDPKPQGKSSPSLRIRHADVGREDWLSESTAIMSYIEDAFPGHKSMVSSDALRRAQALDLITQVNLMGVDFTHYLRHATAVTESWTGLADADRSHAAARNSLQAFTKSVVKLQAGAAGSLEETGWMTPGVEGPGLVDVTLAANLRYMWLSYEFDTLEDERLDRLREWWKRFKQLGWWEDLEETGEVHPPQMRYSKEVREVRNVRGG